MNIHDMMQQGLTYPDYTEQLELYIANTNPETLSGEVLEKYGYIKLNLARMKRIDKTYSPSEALELLLQSVSKKQYWLILSEGWCGDSAQNIPYLIKMAQLSKSIEVRLVLRDSHLEIIDQFLTNGKRSIPKLIVFDEDGNILMQWGSRPATAQALVSGKIQEGLTKPEWEPLLHAWYAKDKGVTLESEMMNLLSPIV